MRRSITWAVVTVVLAMGPAAYGAVQVKYDLDSSSIVGANPLPGTPEYTWWYGCSPTAGGMMVGYWDGKPGYENLFEGDASYWWGNASPPITGTRSMVAGTAHIVAGIENGAYGDWHNSPSYPAHESNPDSLADFMRTVDGGTESPWIAKGLEDYVEWDNPATATNESGPGPGLYFDALVELRDIAFYGGSFDYNDFKAEIDADRPVLLTVTTNFYGYSLLHNVVGYGYKDNMFTLSWPDGTSPPPVVTVGGIAVMDTWDNGTAGSEWVGPYPGYATIYPSIDSDGVEWWPFLEFREWSFFEYSDWMVYQGITMDIAIVPEPASIVVWSLLGALGVLAGWHRRRRAA